MRDIAKEVLWRDGWERLRAEPVPPVVELGLRVIAEMVRSRRRELGMTQRELADRCGIHQSTISRLENCRLRGIRLLTLATVLGVLENPAEFDARWR